MRPVSTLENVFTGAIWVFGCCFFLPRRFTQMTLPLKVRVALKRMFNHNHPVSNWKERIHYGGPLKSWLNSPYLQFGGKDCCIAQQFWCICLHFAISSISLENCCKLFRYTAFCGKMLLNLTWKHIFWGFKQRIWASVRWRSTAFALCMPCMRTPANSDRFGGNCWCGSLWMLSFMLAYRMRSDAKSSPNRVYIDDSMGRLYIYICNVRLFAKTVVMIITYNMYFSFTHDIHI